MLHLPRPIIKVLHPFRSLFRKPTWEHAQTLLVGAILTPGPRTVAAALRILGLAHEPHFQTYHRVLNRATWSSRSLSHLLLLLLLRAFVPDDAPLVVGIDETIERRRGAQIAAKGIYRDPVRSSKEHFVKTSGLRWVSLHLLAPIPWLGRVWALPVLTVLAPSERYHAQRGKRHKKVHEWGRQMIRQLRRWRPQRPLVVVAASTYAVIELLAACQRLACPVTMVTRWRLDAALYDPAPARVPGTAGRPRVKGARQPTLAERLVASTTNGRWRRSSGMAAPGGRWSWRVARRCGITAASRQSPCAGC
jgi:DDE superfamily endonuclease